MKVRAVTMMPELEVLNSPVAPRRDRKADVRDILGVNVSVLTGDCAIDQIRDVIDHKGLMHIAFLNAHGANLAYRDEEYRQTLKSFTVLSDGVGVDLGSAILYGDKFPQNLNGTDFVPQLFRHLKKPLRIGLLGARPGTADLAVEKFENDYPQHQYIVFGHGYFDADSEQKILADIRLNRPDILLVALGNPNQEQWINQHCSAEVASVAIGVGALLDFVAGRVKRAPRWMISYRLEWVYRLWLEPQRMWKRYVLGNPAFMVRVFKQRLFGERSGAKEVGRG